MSLVLGLDGFAYRNSGTDAVPVWELLENITDVNLNMTKESADVTVRGGNGWVLSVDTLKNFSVTFDMIYDTDDAEYDAIQSAFLNNTVYQYAFCDADIAVSGTKGFKAFCSVSNFSRAEALRDAFRVSVELTATYHNEGGSIIAPTDFTIP